MLAIMELRSYARVRELVMQTETDETALERTGLADSPLVPLVFEHVGRAKGLPRD